MEVQQFRSPLSYSVQNEDYQTEQAVLRARGRGTPARVLIVASSGENALSLLADEQVESVDAVDLNPSQVHLCALRLAALETLTLFEQITLLGCDPVLAGRVGAADRLELFDSLLPHLPEAARQYWVSRRDTDVAFGIHHVGANDVAMRDIVAGVRAAGFAPLQQAPGTDQLERWTQVYADIFTSDYIRATFGVASEALAGRIAGISRTLGECHFNALRAPAANHNYFVTTVFASRYAAEAGAAGYPLYLQPTGQDALRARNAGARLHLAVGNLLEQMPRLAAARGGFDLISISNIPDWMSEEEFRGVVLRAAECLRPGGALLSRTATARPMIVEVTGRHMHMDSAFNAELASVERGPWFRVIAAGFTAPN